jgi:hypothetical protein
MEQIVSFSLKIERFVGLAREVTPVISIVSNLPQKKFETKEN